MRDGNGIALCIMLLGIAVAILLSAVSHAQVQGVTDLSRNVMRELTDNAVSATGTQSSPAQMKLPESADSRGATPDQAGTLISDQKKPADCAALQQDLFIDLKVVVKAGCTPSPAQIAKLLDNPVGNFVAIPFQYDYVQFKGPKTEGTRFMHRLQLTPTFPLSIGRDWNLINRVVFPFLSAPVNKGFGDCLGSAPGPLITQCPNLPGLLSNPFERTNGFGDIAYVVLASPKDVIKTASGGAVIWGLGATSMFPTASEEVLGTGKYSLGPAAAFGYLGPEWIVGAFPQHWWSIAGDDKRADVSLTNIQYFIYWAPPGGDPNAQWRIGMSPNISINWKAQGDKVTVPVGLGIGRMFEIAKLPVRIEIEADYSVIRPDDKVGSRWDFRVYFVPVIPTFLF